MTDQAIRDAKQEMEQVLSLLSEQLKTLHVGRATSSLVENIEIDQYGARVPLKQVGSITIPEPTQIAITPWDKSALGAIEAAIRASDLGVNPVNDGQAVRVILPPLTQERRAELTKVVGKMAEEARIALRSYRHDSWEKIQKAAKETVITEDERDRGRKELDRVIDEMNKKIAEIAAEKERDLMAI